MRKGLASHACSLVSRVMKGLHGDPTCRVLPLALCSSNSKAKRNGYTPAVALELPAVVAAPAPLPVPDGTVAAAAARNARNGMTTASTAFFLEGVTLTMLLDIFLLLLRLLLRGVDIVRGGRVSVFVRAFTHLFWTPVYTTFRSMTGASAGITQEGGQNRSFCACLHLFSAVLAERFRRERSLADPSLIDQEVEVKNCSLPPKPLSTAVGHSVRKIPDRDSKSRSCYRMVPRYSS